MLIIQLIWAVEIQTSNQGPIGVNHFSVTAQLTKSDFSLIVIYKIICCVLKIICEKIK